MHKHRILVVDDEPASVRGIERTLAADYCVVTTTSAKEGVAALAAEPFALLIADQRMREMTGTELLAHCAAQHPEVIRILLTGYSGIETLVEAINAGQVYYYFTKPWEPQELRLAVQRGIERYEIEAERRRLMCELGEACGRVRREADQKSRLLTLAAHELGTPVHLLSNALALLAETELAPAARSWLGTAQRSAAWLGRGLVQMASAARWRASRLKLHCRLCDLNAVLQALETAFAQVRESRALVLRFELAPLPALNADPRWLERALSNLIANAVRFTPDGGTVTVSARAGAARVEITVADTGIGIDPGLLEELFEPFSAAGGDVAFHGSGRFEFGARGLGLGLAIAKAIIDEHGGTIAVRSQPGAGSVFTVRLPLASPAT
jgi:two-component system, sensor histidine kinase and response regulator